MFLYNTLFHVMRSNGIKSLAVYNILGGRESLSLFCEGLSKVSRAR